MSVIISPNLEILFEWRRADISVPSISVVVPLFNYGHFLVETLESVSRQTLENLDLVIVDDDSTDDSAEVARQWLDKHGERFRKASLLKHRNNAGLAQTRNDGFSQTETEFVFPLDADNLIYPTCLKKLEQSLQSSAASFAYCLVERFTGGLDDLKPPYLMHLYPWDAEKLGLGNTIDAMVLMRKSVWELVGGYSVSMPRPGWEDYDFWFKLARANGYGLQVHEILARYRVHSNSMLHTVTNHEKSQKELDRYMREKFPEFFIGIVR